jgi:aldehyde:ferredoxin oxidoreductase
MAQKIFTDEPEPIGEQEDLQKLFVRILEREDWTDRLASGLGKIRNKIGSPAKKVKVSKEPRVVINHSHADRKPSEERRAMMNRSHWDTNLPAELRLLVPDMREVEKAYVEMTTGYKEFIRDVLKANRLREKALNNSSPIEGS